MKLYNWLSKLLSVILVGTLGLIPLIWFLGKGNVLLNGVDINFPLNPTAWFERRFFVWNDIANAGIDFSSSTAGLFFHLVQVVPYKLGFDLTSVQIISLIFWFLLIILAAYILARKIFSGNYLVQILFVIFYAFNIYMFNTWENIKVSNLSLVVAIPLVLTVFLSLRERSISKYSAIFFSSLIGIIISGGGINPSYFITFLFILFVLFFAEILLNFKIKTIKIIILDLLVVTIPIIFVNLFWILPTLNFIFNNISASGSIDKLGFTNWVDSLSENTSLVNIFRLQGAWDWYAIDSNTELPIYIPYALNYFHRLPFIIFSFLIPSLAFLSFLMVNKNNRHLYIAFGLMLIIGVFLGAGTHLPTGTFFRWLMNNLPFFTLFRSPWYIFSPMVTLAYAGLLGLFFYNIFKIYRSRNIKILGIIGIFILIVGNLLYSYPLVTGKIFRPDKPDNFFVQFPPYIFQTKDWLEDEHRGRIISYPADELEKFQWGYRGVDSILNLISNQETIFNSFNTPNASITSLIKQFYLSLRKGHLESAEILAQKLNIGLIFEKSDQPSLAPSLNQKIKSQSIKNIEKWNFYKFPHSETLPKIYTANNTFLGYPYKFGANLMTALDTRDLLIDPADSVVQNIPRIVKNSGDIVLSRNSQAEDFNQWIMEPSKLSNRLISKDLSSVDFNFQIEKDKLYQPILERYSLEEFGLNLTKNMEINLDGENLMLQIVNLTDSYVYFNPISLNKGNHILKIKLQNKNLVMGGNFNDEANFEKSLDGKFSIEEIGGEKYLTILNILKMDVHARFPIQLFDPLVKYYMEVKYKQIYGNNASVLVTQATQNTLVKAQTERLPNYPEWNTFSFYYEPVDTDSYSHIVLTAPFISDPLGTKVLYDDVKIFKVFNNNLFLKEVTNRSNSSVVANFNKKSPVEYEGSIQNSDQPHILVLSENYSPGWEITIYDEKGLKQLTKAEHFGANSYANAWYIEGVPNSYKFRIYYQPQDLFWLGFSISIGTLIFSMLFFINNLRNKKYV